MLDLICLFARNTPTHSLSHQFHPSPILFPNSPSSPYVHIPLRVFHYLFTHYIHIRNPLLIYYSPSTIPKPSHPSITLYLHPPPSSTLISFSYPFPHCLIHPNEYLTPTLQKTDITLQNTTIPNLKCHGPSFFSLV